MGREQEQTSACQAGSVGVESAGWAAAYHLQAKQRWSDHARWGASRSKRQHVRQGELGLGLQAGRQLTSCRQSGDGVTTRDEGRAEANVSMSGRGRRGRVCRLGGSLRTVGKAEME